MEQRKSTRSPRRWKKPPGETPFIVKLFERHIRNWGGSSSIVQALPKNANFSYLMFSQSRVGLFETKWNISAVYEAIPREAMNEEAAILFRKIKGLECSMTSKGLLRKTYRFKPLSILQELQKELPEFKPSDELSELLNQDAQLIQLLNALKPDDMTISLHSIPLEYQPFARSLEATIKGMAEFYRNPSYITWVVTFSRMISRGPGVQKIADNAMELFNHIFEIINRKMNEIQPNIVKPFPKRRKPKKD
jgi:hypothetical protein